MKPLPIVAEVWCVHEAMRRYGFESADIFVRPGDDGRVIVLLRRGDADYTIIVGEMGVTKDVFAEAWTAFGAAVNTGEVSDAELAAMWDASKIRTHAVALASELVFAGLLPRWKAEMN